MADLSNDIGLADHADHGALRIAHYEKVHVRDTQEPRRLKHRNGLSNGDEPLTRYR